MIVELTGAVSVTFTISVAVWNSVSGKAAEKLPKLTSTASTPFMRALPLY